MAGLGTFIFILGLLGFVIGILADEIITIIIGFAIFLTGGIIKDYADRHNPIIIEQKKQERLRDEIETLESKRNTWKYYQRLKKGNSKLEQKLKQLKEEDK